MQKLPLWRDESLVHGDVKPANILIRLSRKDAAPDGDVPLPNIRTFLADVEGSMRLQEHARLSSSSSSDRWEDASDAYAGRAPLAFVSTLCELNT